MILSYLLEFLVYFFLFCLAFAFFITLLDRSLRSKGYHGPVSDHFDGKVFFNIKHRDSETRPPRKQRLVSVLWWMLRREKNVWEKRQTKQTKPATQVEGSELVATLINHTTALIQTNGLNILTDPMYAKRASPFSFLGPERFTDPGVSFDDLPHIDLILLSHNHYDHLDLATLKRLAKRDNPPIITTLGNQAFLASHGITNSTELDWWQSVTLKNISTTCVPAQHFSARAISDRNKTLWGGFVIHAAGGDIYFAGDTGEGPFVDQIAQRFPNGFRLGLLPVGAYRPEWFMSEVHISPDQAYAMQTKLSIKDVVATHLGTFRLADDTQDEPAERIRAIIQASVSPNQFHILSNGESLRLT